MSNGPRFPCHRPSTAQLLRSRPKRISRGEALHEALEALTSTRLVAAAMHTPTGPTRIFFSAKRVRYDVDLASEEALDDAIEDIPALPLFHLLLCTTNSTLASIPPDEKSSDLTIHTPAEIFGMSNAEYERTALSAFGSAEEWARRVALGLKSEVERVLGTLSLRVESAKSITGGHVAGEKAVSGISAMHEGVEWVKALGMVLEARAGVKIGLPL